MAVLDASNADIINTIRANASLDYQTRVPVTTQANLAKTFSEIQSYEPLWNEFQSLLVGRIGLTLMDKNLVFNNPLRPLKSGAMQYGSMVQELDLNLIEGEEYDPNATNVFEAQKVDVAANYHKVNRRNKYKIRVNPELLKEAFLSNGQLAPYVNQMIAIPEQSANWDEYKLCLQLLSEYQKADGFANLQVPDISTATTSDEAEFYGKQITRKIREAYDYIKGFYHNEFNPANRDAFTTEFVLIVTPKVKSYIDVFTLAGAFNMDKAQWLADRVIVVDKFPSELTGTQALMVDNAFYRVFDTDRFTRSIQNPDTGDMIYVRHIWQILSLSRFKNALRFSTDADNVSLGDVTVSTKSVSEVSITTAADSFDRGDVILIGATVTYDDESTDAAAFYEITAVNADGTSTAVLPETGVYIDRMGYLHIANDAAIEGYKSLTVTAVATKDHSHSASKTLTGPNAIDTDSLDN